MLNFGSGRAVALRNDITGQTPAQFGALQDISVDLSFTEKELMGQNQFPITIARGGAKFSIKAKAARIDGTLFNNIFFGGTLAAGKTEAIFDEAHNVPSTSPYTITATQSATFNADEGVTYAGPLGLDLQLVTSLTTAGQYEVSTSGLYTFDSADSGVAVLLNYLYTSTAGESIAIANLIQGTTPTFGCVFRNRDPSTGLYTTLVLYKCHASKLSLASKGSDWSIPEFDISVMDNGSGQIGILSWGDKS
jgi:hypothetical protein